MNIRLEYLYRDGGNFKNWGEVVFSNPREIAVDAIASMADQVLIDHQYFVASKAGVADLHFAESIGALDHGWHEAHAFLATDDPPNDARGRSIEEFIEALGAAATSNRCFG